MGVSRPAALVALWAAGVTVSTVVSYSAVSRVASDVTDRVSAPISQRSAEIAGHEVEERSASPSPAASHLPSASESPGSGDSGSGGGPDGSQLPGGDHPGTPTSPGSALEHPSTAPHPSSDAGGDDAGPAPSAASSPGDTQTQSSAPTVTKSFSSVGGVATVSCSGSTATLRTWDPASGFTAEIDKATGSEAAINFVREDPQHTSEIRVQCDNGQPVGQVTESTG